METYAILGIGIVGYFVYSHYNKNNENNKSVNQSKQTPYLNTYPTGTHKFNAQVMPGLNISFMNSNY